MYDLISLWTLLPEIILAVGACAVLLLGVSSRPAAGRWAPGVVLGTLLAAIAAVVIRARLGFEAPTPGSGLAYGSLAFFARNSALVLGVILTFVAWLQPQTEERGEFWSMMLLSLLGVLLVGAAEDLLILFVGLELVSIPTYILVALSRRNVRALEAGTKYFYLGALSAAIMAYGFSLLYGVGGSTSLADVGPAVAAALAEPGTLAHGLASAGVLLAFVGLLFKIAAVPMHFYVADVYQGAASPVAGLLGFVPKFAGFLAIFKVLLVTGNWMQTVPAPAVYWTIWIVAAVSMTVGNALALMQTNIKRMLAYSGIAHSGYMLVGVLIGPSLGDGLLGDGTAAVLYYVVVYGIANLAAFAVLGLLRVGGEPCETLRHVAGLLRRHPWLALLMALAMLTLMGLPPTAGFWGKLSLFGGALVGLAGSVEQGQVTGEAFFYNRWLLVLVIVGVLNSAMAAAYYLRVVAAVLLYENDQPAQAMPREAEHMGALFCGVLLVMFALCPAWLLEPSRRATEDLRREAATVYMEPVAAAPEVPDDPAVELARRETAQAEP
ncbi:MAG: NADH-quinone oxidoreductase subunit N [Phycisphaerae bacterium]|jgi:NADH-quinone oxidoreductase subunit N